MVKFPTTSTPPFHQTPPNIEHNLRSNFGSSPVLYIIEAQ
jgi:hypothetical protein